MDSKLKLLLVGLYVGHYMKDCTRMLLQDNVNTALMARVQGSLADYVSPVDHCACSSCWFFNFSVCRKLRIQTLWYQLVNGIKKKTPDQTSPTLGCTLALRLAVQLERTQQNGSEKRTIETVHDWQIFGGSVEPSDQDIHRTCCG